MSNKEKSFTEEIIDEIFKDLIKLSNILAKKPTQPSTTPLKTIPESKKKLYGFLSPFKTILFDTKEQLDDFIKNTDPTFSYLATIDYLGQMFDKTDVIKITNTNGTYNYYTPVDTDGYAIYNEQQSIATGTVIWTYQYGSLKEIYKTLREHGIKLENDVYQKESATYQSTRNKPKQLNLQKNNNDILTK